MTDNQEVGPRYSGKILCFYSAMADGGDIADSPPSSLLVELELLDDHVSILHEEVVRNTVAIRR